MSAVPPFHPLASLFPLMEGRELEEFVADLKENGLREPVWLYEGQILDGRNRWRACEALGREVSFREYTGTDPVGFIVSLNLHRRHLSESQRALVAAKVATLHDGQRADLVEGLPIGRAAELLNVGERSVARAREVLDHGAAELVQAVERGAVSVSAAADVATLSTGEQAELVARGEREILDTARRIRLRRAEGRREDRLAHIARMAEPSPALPSQRRYAVLYADPPWKYEHNEADDRAIENHYPTMELAAIRALPVGALATPAAILFLWAPSPKLAEALSVVEAWGFTYRTCAVWAKPQLGMGYYFRQQHELLLVATRGDMPTPAPADRPPSVVTYDRGAHSVKPPVFRELIEHMYPTLPRIELFARSASPGWSTWGNEVAAA